MLGVVVVLLGLQFRLVDSYVLNETTSRFVAQRASGLKTPAMSFPAMTTRKVFRPPEWSGWCLLSIGAVLVLHSLALGRPSG